MAGSAISNSSKRSRRWPTMPRFRERYAAIKQANKEALARVIEAQTGLAVDPGRAVRRADQAHPRI